MKIISLIRHHFFEKILLIDLTLVTVHQRPNVPYNMKYRIPGARDRENIENWPKPPAGRISSLRLYNR